MSPTPKYDAIFIGSGLGCLSAAGFLARHGQRVLILERHTVPGGFTHTFKRKGYEWDVGVHYVGQVGNEKSLMRRVFDYLSDQKLTWSPLGELYDEVHMDGRRLRFVQGREALRAQLLAAFPNEKKALDAYFMQVSGAGLSSALFFGERSMPWFLSQTVGRWMRFRFKKMAQKSTYDVLKSCGCSEDLIAALCAQCGDYGLPPKQSSFGAHASLVNHYLDGAHYPVGGADSIARTLWAGIQARGGELKLSTTVTQVLAEKGRAVGVELESGERIYGKKIISGVGARQSFTQLWPKNVQLPKILQYELEALKPSIAHVCLYVGLKASDQDLKLPKNNIWIYDQFNMDHAFAERADFTPPVTYISFPSAKDPSWSARHPGRATVQVIAACPYAWVEKWRESRWKKRGPAYDEFKKNWEQTLLQKLYSAVPQVRGHVEYCEVSTPLSTAHFSGHPRGEIYGLEHTPKRFQVSWLRAHTPLKGYYLTGQDIVMVGVGGALMSGVLTAVAVLRRNVLWPVFRDH